MKKVLLFTVLLCSNYFLAQNGNTINDAIEVNGTNASVNFLDFDNATDSGLVPACGSNEDVFYKHTTTSGHNKMTFGMTSAGVSVITQVDYQIFAAPNNDINQLQVLDCDDYTVFAIVGGSFQYVIEDVDDTNTYYLRVYKTSGLGGSLTDLLNGTTITMDSEYDNTLSLGESNQNNFKHVVKANSIDFYNNTVYSKYSIYGLDGKKILSNKSNQDLNSIDISQLRSGLYILNLEGQNQTETFKFVKK